MQQVSKINNHSNIKVKTPSGFQLFKGMNCSIHDQYYHIVLSNKREIKCSVTHKFHRNGKFLQASNVQSGDFLNTDVFVVSIELVKQPIHLYDIITVDGGNIYCHDGDIESHNSNDFLGTGNTLINANAIMGLTSKPCVVEYDGVKIYDYPDKSRKYMQAVDVAKGRGQDYSTFSIIDVTEKPFKQVAAYRDNMISPLLFPTILYKYAKMYNEAFIIVENNDQGAMVCNILYYDLEYENMFLSSVIKKDGIGIYMDKKIKRIGCSNFKDLVEQGQLEIVDKDTILEIATFTAKGQSYEADDGCHDDMVMGFVSFAWYTGTPMFNELFDDSLKLMLFKEKMTAIEQDVPSFGVTYDPVEEAIAQDQTIQFDVELDLMGNFTPWDSSDRF